MIGAFYQPRAVLADLDSLKTLPERELKAGIAEVIKHGLIRDAAFFDWLESHLDGLLARDPSALEHAVLRSCEIKSAVVAEDERELDVRALLNFGHTFGHAIEAGLGYGDWLHGEAVGAGMVMAADLSHQLGHLDAATLARIERLIARAGLPVKGPAFGRERYWEHMSVDKKTRDGAIRFVVLERLGSARVQGGVSESVVNGVLDRRSD